MTLRHGRTSAHALQRRRLIGPAGLVAALLLALVPLATPEPAAADSFEKQTLHFRVTTGPEDKVCDIVGDLYVPEGASSTHRVPAIITTNGFGGSKDGQAGFGESMAEEGYAVLSYSGLGFGGSDCKISLNHPEWDGKAASQLISYLGGADGIAFLDDAHTQPAPVLDVVALDATANDGSTQAHDPRVGMFGGSYGGQVQYAVASIDPRLDTIVPIYTWNDLSYSLGPNNTDQTSGVSTGQPGALKLTWGLGFTALGVVTGLENATTDPGRLLPCPNFTTFVCPAIVTAAALGRFAPGDVERLREASVSSYVDQIRIPTLIMHGQKDTLFNLNEAVATYRALRAQGTEVTMIWQSWGHSDESPAPGEFDRNDLDRLTQYQGGRLLNWYDHHLKDAPTDTGPGFAYFRDWVDYTGNATPAYGTAQSYPVGTPYTFHLSGSSLTTDSNAVEKGDQGLLTTAAGLPLNLTTPEEVSLFAQLPVPEFDAPGTTATWTSDDLDHPLEVVGSPELNLRVTAPLSQLLQGSPTGSPDNKVVLFVRVQDVAPDGTASDIHQLTAPVRVPDVRKPFEVTLPAIVHRFDEGHRVRLVVSGSSFNYRGNLLPHAVKIKTGDPNQSLKLPVVNFDD